MSSHRNIKAPRARGYRNLKLPDQLISALSIPEQDSNTVSDLIVHALLTRITHYDNTTDEFLVQYDKDSNVIEIDVPQDVLDKICAVNVGPKAAQYLAWLASSYLNLRRFTRSYTIGGSPITSGMKGIGLEVSYYNYIERIDVFADVAGTIEVDILKTTYDSYPSASSITGGDTIKLNNEIKSSKVDLSLWDAKLRPSDVVLFNVIGSPLTLNLVTIVLHLVHDNVPPLS